MRNRYFIGVTSAAIAILLLCLTGCESPKQGAYKTLAAVGMTVDKSMQAAAEAAVAGKVSNRDWAKIAEVHGKFTVAYKTACDIAAYDYTKFAPADLLEIQAELLNTINTILTR